MKKRIIPCLDIKDGRTVKGVNFVRFRDAGDPVELAREYVKQQADELVFLDITATVEKRKTITELVSRIAGEISIPFTVGGGINSAEDVELLLAAGADKVSINTAAVRNPGLVEEIAGKFGSQCLVVAIDTDRINGNWNVIVDGGQTPTTLGTVEWAVKVMKLGAGEILLTSMDADGTKSGFSIEITRMVTEAVKIPVIASGGAGNMDHFVDVFSQTGCSAALAAGIFHFGEVSIPELKKYLAARNIQVRI